jgi:hypothetical protein
MRLRGWRALLAMAILGGTGVVCTTPIPARAYLFVQEFEKTSKNNNQLSFWERVVYSLIEARNRGADCRAPRMLTS